MELNKILKDGLSNTAETEAYLEVHGWRFVDGLWYNPSVGSMAAEEAKAHQLRADIISFIFVLGNLDTLAPSADVVVGHLLLEIVGKAVREMVEDPDFSNFLQRTLSPKPGEKVSPLVAALRKFIHQSVMS